MRGFKDLLFHSSVKKLEQMPKQLDYRSHLHHF